MTKKQIPYEKEKREIVTYQRTNPKKALSLAIKLRKIAKENQDELQVAVAEYYIGGCEFKLNHYQKSIDTFNRSINVLKKYNRNDVVGHTYNLMGVCYMILGDNQNALNEYLKGIQYCTNSIDKLNMQSNIGLLYFNLGCYREAYKYFEKVYQRTLKDTNIINGEYRRVKGMLQLSAVMVNMADVTGCLNRYQEAYQIIGQLAEYAKEYPLLQEEIEAAKLMFLICKAKVLFGVQKLEAAMACIKEILDYIEDEEVDENEFQDITNLIHLLLLYGHLKEAKQLLQIMENTAKKINTTAYYVDYYSSAVEYYKAEENTEKLIDSYEQYFYYIKQKETLDNQNFVKGINMKISLEKAKEKQKKSEEKTKKLKLLSETDALTGVLNRYSLNKMCDDFFSKAKDEQITFGMMLLDVDCFKEFNDTYGHVKGDECLKAVSKVLKQFQDEDHMVARYGGDEFMLISIGQTADNMKSVAESIVREIEALNIEHKNSKAEKKIVSMTIGVMNHIPEMDETVLDCIQMTDELLYEAKKKKRGMIVCKLEQ